MNWIKINIIKNLNRMYKQNKKQNTSIEVNQTIEGESIETKIERITQNKEAITDGAPLLYTERKDGVLPGTNIKTDRFEVAIEAMDKVSKATVAKRAEKAKMKAEEGGKGETGGESSGESGGESGEGKG